ncbi:MAG: ATP-dependent helicase [Candidatus Wallbacteria bacterium]|nr:ATP-dependent helicase [Candidatus Wallbacteria bacterium]
MSAVRDLLSWYAGRQIADALPERPDVDAVHLLTVHGAKGLEYPTVIILGLDDDQMPAKWAGREPDDIEEERRVLYVGITRARDLCLLSQTEWSTPARGPSKERAPSRFLAEMGLSTHPALVSEKPQAEGGLPF